MVGSRVSGLSGSGVYGISFGVLLTGAAAAGHACFMFHAMRPSITSVLLVTGTLSAVLSYTQIPRTQKGSKREMAE